METSEAVDIDDGVREWKVGLRNQAGAFGANLGPGQIESASEGRGHLKM